MTPEEWKAELTDRVCRMLATEAFSGVFTPGQVVLALSFDNFVANVNDVTAVLRELVASGEVDAWMYRVSKKG